jgi:hypothetical protein
MANLLVLNGVMAPMYLKESGQGTDLDPHVPYVHVQDGMLNITGSVAVGSMPSITLSFASGTNIGAVTLLAGESHVGEVGGNTTIQTDLFIRPNNVTPYTAGDAIASVITSSAVLALRSVNLARKAAGSGHIVNASLWTDQASCTARFRVHFFTRGQPTGAVEGDNVPLTLGYNNVGLYLGYIDLPAMISGAAGSTAAFTQNRDLRFGFVCFPADTNVYYRIVTLDAFTPDAEQSFYLSVSAELN